MINRKIVKSIICAALSVLLSSTVSAEKSDTEKAGDIIQLLLPATAYAATFYLDDNDGRTQFYKSIAANIVITHSLKFLINKERPNGGDNKSFPSGHTSAAFHGAAFIQKRYGWKYGLPAYVAASFVGYSRVYADKHYVEDVIAGAIIGTLSSYYFTSPSRGLSLNLTANSRSAGISIRKKW